LLAEIDRVQQKISGQSSGLTQVSGEYAFLQSSIRNDESTLSTDEAQLMSAQQNALQNQYFLEYIGNPTLPVDPTEPKRLMWIFIIIASTFLAYVIIK